MCRNRHWQANFKYLRFGDGLRLENRITGGSNSELFASMVLRGEGLQLENDEEQLTIAHIKPILDAWITQWNYELALYKQIIDKRHDNSASSKDVEPAT